jgi:excinuclease ABC subunit C
MVVFEDGAPVPQLYRHYALPEAEGTGDDLQALTLWAQRRLAAGPPWPDLVVVDGGQGQVAAVARVLGEVGCAIVGVAKGPSRRAGELEDRAVVPGRKNPLPLRPGSPELLFLQRVRDAAHRFVLAGQRASRRRRLASELESLPGVGTKTAALLRQRFARVSELAHATEEDVVALGIGRRRAQAILEAARLLASEEQSS